jgi:sec-independent protein translocase protein TatC
MAEASNLGRRRRLFRRRRERKAAGATMSVMEHLGELRTRLIISAVAFVGISVVAFFFYEPLLEFFRRPLCSVDPDLLGEEGCDLNFFKVFEAFNFRLKMTALIGIALSSPIWLYQLWAFVTPALTTRERRYALPFMVTSILLFVAGATTAYLVLPTGVRFLIGIGGEGLNPVLGAEEYLNFIGLMLLGFGLLFELPLVIFFLGLAEVLTLEQLRSGRRVAIVVIVALAAVVTPSQDPYTMIILSIPLYLSYELTILLLALALRRRSPRVP